MRYDYSIRSVSDRLEKKSLEKFALEQPFDYPDYEDWVTRAMGEIDIGYKKAIVVHSLQKRNSFNKTIMFP